MDEKYRILELFLPVIAAIISAILASSGLWLFIERKHSSRDITKKLLIGLAHDRIVSLSLQYIERGYITQDEHENLCGFLYEPYIEMGGNGSVKRIMAEVNKLPIKNQVRIKEKSNKYDEQQVVRHS